MIQMLVKLTCVFLLLAACGVKEIKTNDIKVIDSFITDGNNASLLELPWQVSLQKNGKHFCGASIISNKHLLTASHCLRKAPVGSYTVHAGGNGRIENLKILGYVTSHAQPEV